MTLKLDKIKLENITSKLRQTEYLLQPKDTPNDAFWDFINQFLQIDTRTQSVSEADTDDRHSGWLLLIMFIGCAFLVFAPVLVLLWELSWSEGFVKMREKAKSRRAKSRASNPGNSPKSEATAKDEPHQQQV